MLKYRIGNITMRSTSLPINSTTISTRNIINKSTPVKDYIVTISIFTSLQEYSTTTFSSSVIDKPRIKNITNRTCPHNSTSITTKSNLTLRSSTISNTQSMVISEVRIHYCTVMTTPINSTTRSVSNVMSEVGVKYFTMRSTSLPINSTTISTCNVIFKDT